MPQLLGGEFRGPAGSGFRRQGAQTAAPRYDLSLIGEQLLAADKSVPELGVEESLKGNSLAQVIALAGRGGVMFWVGLAAVVAVLLVVIARLLPKPPVAPGL